MKNLQIHNTRFITYSDKLFTTDILGGVDTQQIERMICTLRISYKNYPPIRTTLDLYTDNQTDKLIRTLCEKWELQLLEVSKSVHSMIAQLETYKLQKLKYPQQSSEADFEQSEEEEQEAKKYLADKNLVQNLQNDLEQIGILGEAENALILFLSMASHKFNNPFSVICLAKSGIGKSYLLQKLLECMPRSSYSFHTQISENALYYFDSHQIDGKVLFIEDLEWTHQMLNPLATLQTQGKLVKTRATKDKDGMLHSTTFEVVGKLCLIACAYSEKNYDQLSLPFLCLHLNHSHIQDQSVMDYQKRTRAGLINQTEIIQTQRKLKCVIANLHNVSVINPFAPLIQLPEDLPNPRKTLLLLLNFIDIITYFHQHQRESKVDTQTGEIQIVTSSEDIELAFSLLKNCLFRRVDELSTTARGFYNWLQKFLTEAKTNQFTALDIRKAKRIHPRTLNNYLNELKLYSYVQIVGGNKHREGFIYKLTKINELTELQNGIEQSLKKTIEKIKAAQPNSKGEAKPKQQIIEKVKAKILEVEPIKKQPTETKKETTKVEPIEKLTEDSSTTQKPTRIRINDKEKHTLKLLLEFEAEQSGREYLPKDFTAITNRNHITEARHLKTLCDQGKLTRQWRNRQYYYRLKTAKTGSKQVSQTPPSDSQTPTI